MNGQLVNAIRQAFASGEFAKAQRLWSEYAVQLQRMIAGGTATAAMLSETRDLIDSSALMVKVHQAHAEHQLKGLFLAGLYQTRTYQRPEPDPTEGIQVSF